MSYAFEMQLSDSECPRGSRWHHWYMLQEVGGASCVLQEVCSDLRLCHRKVWLSTQDGLDLDGSDLDQPR